MASKSSLTHWLENRRQTLQKIRIIRGVTRLFGKKTQFASSSKTKTPKNACPINKCWQRPTVLVTVWVVLLVASLSVTSFAVTPFLKVLQSQHVLSLGWSGYVVTSDALLKEPVVMGVNSSWIVPNVTPTRTDAYSSAWIGIGGHTDQTLIQCGTEHDSVNGKAQYSVWYEMLPEYSITIPEIKVQPGDKISASISMLNSDENEWLIKIDNLSNGQGWSRSFLYNSSRLSAEWVAERPQINGKLTELANFGSVTFTDTWAKLKDTSGSMTSFPSNTVTMSTHENAELTKVSQLSSDDSSFTVEYIGNLR